MDSFATTTENQRQIMLPIYYALFLGGAIIGIVLLVKRVPKHALHHLGTILLSVSCTSAFLASFFYLSENWIEAFQTINIALFGIYASLKADKDSLYIFAWMSLFNFFCSIGAMNIPGAYNGFINPLTNGGSVTSASCCGYFYSNGGVCSTNPQNGTYGLCYGYVSYLFVIGPFIAFLQIIQAFLAWYLIHDARSDEQVKPLVKEAHHHHHKEEATSGYEAISE